MDRTSPAPFHGLSRGFFASQGKEVEKDYSELCALLNVRAYDHVSKIRETMGLSLTDLVNIGYLKSWDTKPMSSKVGYKLILTPGQALKDVLLLTQRKQLAFAAAHLESPLTAVQEQLKSDLVGHGISPVKAVELVKKFEANALRDHLDYAGLQLTADRNGNIKNPAGYVISFIESDQTIPPSFETRDQPVMNRRQLADTQPGLLPAAPRIHGKDGRHALGPFSKTSEVCLILPLEGVAGPAKTMSNDLRIPAADREAGRDHAAGRPRTVEGDPAPCHKRDRDGSRTACPTRARHSACQRFRTHRSYCEELCREAREHDHRLPGQLNPSADHEAVRAELLKSGMLSEDGRQFLTLSHRSDVTGPDRTWAAMYRPGDVVQ